MTIGFRVLINVMGSAMLSAMLVYSSLAMAVPLSLSQIPLVLGGSVDPNVMFILDDSGSMQWEMLPDEATITRYVYPISPQVYGGDDFGNIVVDFDTTNVLNAMGRSAQNNLLYYDPRITYVPWSRADGSLFPNATIDCAPHNPFNPERGCRNLTADNTESAFWLNKNSVLNFASQTFWPAVYWFFNGGDRLNLADYTYVEIRPARNAYPGQGRTDCAAPPNCTYQEEIQNFANWYSYYRSRILASRAGIGRAFAGQGSQIRVGFASINAVASEIDGENSPGSVVMGVRPFSGSDRQAFFDRLYGNSIARQSESPLRRALDDVGQYFERSDNQGPWGQTPGTDDNTEQLSCRQSFTVMMTDGFENGANARTTEAQANVDDSSGPSIVHATNPALTFQYQPAPPFRDDFDNTLADVSMYYWNRDLRPDLANNVPFGSSDPAFWQHLVNFMINLGSQGTLDPATSLPGLTAGTLAWPDPLTDSRHKIDDQFHAAVNSRGEFLNALNTAQFSNAFANLLTKLSDRITSSNSSTLSVGVATGSGLFYQAEFNSLDWSGRVQAFPVNSNGSLGAAIWDAGPTITAQNFNTGREILSLNPVSGNGIPFRFANLDTAQQAALNLNPATLAADGLGPQRLNYLRGDDSQEQRNGGPFRDRTSNLGDIVNSGLALVGGANSIFPDVWDDLTIVGDNPPESSVPFSGFRVAVAERQQILYFGANDGKLHGIDAGRFDVALQSFGDGTGSEELAYVPSVLFDELNRLTDPGYIHRYYVDATPTVGEAFYGGAWHTVLGSGLGAGGQAVFALDITNPADFDESRAASLVLWEFTDANDPDLGNTLGQPVNIVRLHSGQWAAVFGNGYNNTAPDGNVSATGNAVLFVVDLATGALIRKFDTGEGIGAVRVHPNGLGEAAPVDVDGDFIVDYVYAGDFYGNLWKFDLSSPNPASWGMAFGGQPLFRAFDDVGNAQPITTRPAVGTAPVNAQAGTPLSRGSIVYFGTGKFFEVGDNSTIGQPTQSFYAVLDKQLSDSEADFSPPPFSRTHLLEQTIDDEVLSTDSANPFGFDLRLTSANDLAWHTCAGLPSAVSGCTIGSDGNPAADYLGWRMDLLVQGSTDNRGERIVANPLLRAGRILITTLVPNAEPCESGGSGWLLELDAATGRRLTVQAFDLNLDQLFDEDDRIDVPDGSGGSVSVNVSGKRSTVGTISTPVIVGTGDSGSERFLQSGSSGTIESTLGTAPDVGRLDWQQLP